jgi:hypothetical protein
MHCDCFLEFQTQQFPSLLPAIGLDETAQGQNSLATRSGPGHAGLFQTLGDQGFTGSFDDATGNGELLTYIGRIMHTVLLVAEIGQLCL